MQNYLSSSFVSIPWHTRCSEMCERCRELPLFSLRSTQQLSPECLCSVSTWLMHQKTRNWIQFPFARFQCLETIPNEPRRSKHLCWERGKRNKILPECNVSTTRLFRSVVSGNSEMELAEKIIRFMAIAFHSLPGKALTFISLQIWSEKKSMDHPWENYIRNTLKTPGQSSLANLKKGSGFSLKNSSSNIACGEGRLYSCKLSYSPVPGLLKSGIPAAVLTRKRKWAKEEMMQP